MLRSLAILVLTNDQSLKCFWDYKEDLWNFEYPESPLHICMVRGLFEVLPLFRRSGWLKFLDFFYLRRYNFVFHIPVNWFLGFLSFFVFFQSEKWSEWPETWLDLKYLAYRASRGVVSPLPVGDNLDFPPQFSPSGSSETESLPPQEVFVISVQTNCQQIDCYIMKWQGKHGNLKCKIQKAYYDFEFESI